MNKAFNYTPKFNQSAINKRICNSLGVVIDSLVKDTIRLDEKTKLINGQHRLKAITKQGY